MKKWVTTMNYHDKFVNSDRSGNSSNSDNNNDNNDK